MAGRLGIYHETMSKPRRLPADITLDALRRQAAAVLAPRGGRAKLLVEHGADATSRLEDGTTLPKAAMLAGHPDLAEFLVVHGAKRPWLAAAHGGGAR